MNRRKLNLVVATLVLLLGVGVYAHGRPGDIDPGFGNDGQLYSRWSPVVTADSSIRMVDFYSTINCCFPGGAVFQNLYSLDAAGKPLANRPPLNFPPARFLYLRDPLLVARNGDLMISASLANTTQMFGEPTNSVPWQVGILRLGSEGVPISQFGNDGVAGLLLETVPMSVGASRAVAAMVETEDGRIVVAVADTCVANLQGPFAGNSLEYGATEDAAWGLPINGEFCVVTRRLERARALVRLLPDGRLDTTFGSGGVVLLESLGEITLLGLQPGGAIVLSDRQGHLRRFGPDGMQTGSRDFDLQDASGFALADGSLLLAGRRPSRDQKLWMERLQPDLSTQASTSFDIGKDSLGRDGLSVHPLEARGSLDGLRTYIAINLFTPNTRDYLCGGIVRVDLGADPSLDPTFGKNGFSCISRSGFTGGETHLVAYPGEGLLLHRPGAHYMDRWSSGDDYFSVQKIWTGEEGPAPGSLSIQGMNHALWREPGRVRLVVGRSGGRSGSVGATWRVGVGAHYGNAEIALTGVPRSGVLTWADGDESDREITFQLPPVANDGRKSRVAELRIYLTDATGGVGLDENATRIAVRDVESSLAQTNTIGAVPDSTQSGGGALGVPAVVSLLLWAEGMRRRRMHGIN